MSVVVLIPGYRGRLRAVERWRVRTALATLSAHGDGRLIVSGHHGEAERLAALVPPEVKVILEPTAASTFDNVKKSLDELGRGEMVAIASDRFHVRRAAGYLRQLQPSLADRLVPPARSWWSGWWMDAGGAGYELLLMARRLSKRRN